MALKLGSNGSKSHEEKTLEEIEQVSAVATPFNFATLKKPAAQSIGHSDQDTGPSKPGPSWLLQGDDAHDALQADRERIEAAKAAFQANQDNPKAWRFWLKKGETAHIVFLDGELAQSGKWKGNLQYTVIREHTVKLKSGSWENFLCPEEFGEPCPIVDENGDHRPALCALFTVIDTRTIPGKNGKVYHNERRLFVAKPGTLTALQKIAALHGGLRGLVIDATRDKGDQSPRVGSVHLPLGTMTETQMMEAFGDNTPESIAPFDYGVVIPEVSAEQIAAQIVGGSLGIGKVSAFANKTAPVGPPKEDIPF